MKKGQFYLFTSLLLIILVVGIIPKSVQIYKSQNVFDELIDNFNEEIGQVINNALYNQENMTEMLDKFSTRFINYARQRDANFGYVLIMRNNNETIIINTLKEQITIDAGTIINISQGDYTVVDSDAVVVYVDDVAYNYNLEDAVDVMVLFKSSKGEDIYIKEVKN